MFWKGFKSMFNKSEEIGEIVAILTIGFTLTIVFLGVSFSIVRLVIG